jgi:hypothetical protein
MGTLDLYDEVTSYAACLAPVGVPIDLHVHSGAPHGWERFAPQSDSACRAMRDRGRVVAAL